MKKINLNKKTKFLLIGTGIVIALTMFAIFSFTSKLVEMDTNSTDNSLLSITLCNTAEVRAVFDRYISTLKNLAIVIERYEDFKSQEVLSLLTDVVKNEGFEHIAIDYANGKSYTTDGHIVDIEQFGYIDKIKNGEPFVLDVINAVVDGTPVVGILVPLHDKNGEPIAALRCDVKADTLSEIFNNTFFNADGYYRLIDSNGRDIGQNKRDKALIPDDNFFNTIQKLTYADGYSAEQIMKAFTDKKKGFIKYSYKGQHRFAYYAPIGINDWVLMMVLPKHIVEQRTNAYMNLALQLIFQIVLILFIIMLYVYFSQKHLRNKAQISERCFKALAAQINMVIFEWDFSLNRISSMTNFTQLFGREAYTQNSPEDALAVNAIHEDDREIYTNIFNAITSGANITDKRFRVIDGNGNYRWCSLSGVVITDSKGNPYKAVASLEIIDEQIQKEKELRQKAEQDQLTGLYNKSTTELLIKRILIDRQYNDTSHALMIIDIDNFKNVNDKLGHMCGDQVIAYLADKLQKIFRADDIVGRVGGDEFFVFLKNINGIELVKNKANEICSVFDKLKVVHRVPKMWAAGLE